MCACIVGGVSANVIAHGGKSECKCVHGEKSDCEWKVGGESICPYVFLGGVVTTWGRTHQTSLSLMT